MMKQQHTCTCKCHSSLHLQVAENPSHMLVSMAMEAGTGDLWVISEDGTVHSVSSSGGKTDEGVFHIG